MYYIWSIFNIISTRIHIRSFIKCVVMYNTRNYEICTFKPFFCALIVLKNIWKLVQCCRITNQFGYTSFLTFHKPTHIRFRSNLRPCKEYEPSFDRASRRGFVWMTPHSAPNRLFFSSQDFPHHRLNVFVPHVENNLP